MEEILDDVSAIHGKITSVVELYAKLLAANHKNDFCKAFEPRDDAVVLERLADCERFS